MSANGSPSTKHYEPVQHHDDHDDDDQEEHAPNTNNTNDDSFDTANHSNDLLAIRMESSQEDDDDDDDDDKTEPTSNLHHFNNTNNIHSSSSHHLSFDLEEEESELSRYRLSPSSSSVSQHSSDTTTPILLSSKRLSFSTLWQAYLEMRMSTRRRRAEQLLNMNQDSLQERLVYTVQVFTNVFDTRGLVVHFLVFLTWILICKFQKQRRGVIVGVGLVCIVLRIVWRPVYWVCVEKKRQERRQETMAIYDQLNGSSSWNNNVESHDEDDEHELHESNNIV